MQTKITFITEGIEPISELTTTRKPSTRDTVLNGRRARRVRIAFIAGKSARPINLADMLNIDSFWFKIKFLKEILNFKVKKVNSIHCDN
jgi:hypothetical protein